MCTGNPVEISVSFASIINQEHGVMCAPAPSFWRHLKQKTNYFSLCSQLQNPFGLSYSRHKQLKPCLSIGPPPRPRP